MTELNDKWYNLTELVAITRLHKNTIRGYVRVGRVEAKKVKGKFGHETMISHKSLVNAGIPVNGNGIGVELGGGITCEGENEGAVRGNVGGDVRGDNTPFISAGLYKEMILRYEQALVRLGQLENQRLMLTERAESLQSMEEKYRDEIAGAELEKARLKDEIIDKEKALSETIEGKKEYMEKLREREIRLGVAEEEKKRLETETQKMREEVEAVRKEQEKERNQLEKERMEKQELMRQLFFLNMPWWKKVFYSKAKLEAEAHKLLSENKREK